MNKGELRTYIMTDSHRTGLAPELVDGFIRRAEGLMFRKLRAAEMDAQATLDDDSRVTAGEGVYTLPTGTLQVRRVYYDGRPLEPVSINTIATYRDVSFVAAYAVLGERIEFGGVPPEAAELRLDYFGRLAALTDDADENALLSAHEDLYIHGGKYYLYLYTQDRELAQDELTAFLDAVDSLNEELGRRLGGAGAAPMYDFGGGGGY